MVSEQTTQLWTLAKDANEYERMHNLFSGKLKSVLNDEKISSVLREKTAMALGSEELVFALHDPCDIRKPYSKKLDNLGRVRDLQGNMINGYSTLGTVCLTSECSKKTPCSSHKLQGVLAYRNKFEKSSK